MSWARNWATRASDPLQASAATPLAARSWLTMLNWTPAAPPTLATGGAGFATGLGRTATGGFAVGAIATAGAGVGPAKQSAARETRPYGYPLSGSAVYHAEATTKSSSCPSSWPGRIAIIAR